MQTHMELGKYCRMISLFKRILPALGIHFESTTHNNCGYDPETAQYVLIDMWNFPEYKDMFEVCRSWGIRVLAINKHDYSNVESFKKFGVWFICKDSSTLTMLELKYKNFIKCVISRNEMEMCISATKTFLDRDRMLAIGEVLRGAKRINE